MKNRTLIAGGDRPKSRACGEAFLSLIVAGLACAFLSSCAVKPLSLEAVGPINAVARSGDGEGRLVVFTKAEDHSNGDVNYSTPSSYRVLGADGKLFKYVQNRTDMHNVRPELVSLPAGWYTVVATAEDAGLVSIPVLIIALKTTEIHLEHGWKPELKDRSNRDLVRTPGGQIVGWRAPGKSAEPLDEKRAEKADAIVKVKLVRAADVIGTAAYALVETVAVIRNYTDQPIRKTFTVGYRNVHKEIPAETSIIYLKLVKRDSGGFEWQLLGE